jgi:hypothetical protein
MKVLAICLQFDAHFHKCEWSWKEVRISLEVLVVMSLHFYVSQVSLYKIVKTGRSRNSISNPEILSSCKN